MAFTLTYNPNNGSSGSVPAGPASFANGAVVTVLGNTKNLAVSNGYFVYWNTAADGSGTVYNPGATFTITANTTLYAQYITLSGNITTNLTGGGLTTNFAVTYPTYTGLPAAQLAPIEANLVANANYLLAGTPARLEAAFNTATGWFATPGGKFGASNRQAVVLDQINGGGAYNNGYPSTIHVDGQYLNSTVATAGDEVAMVFAAEFVEVLMAIAKNWNAGDSSGEGLSQYCAYNLFPAGYNNYYGNEFALAWLNGTGANVVTNQNTVSPNAARSDFVTKTYTGSSVGGVSVHGDGDPVSFGCALNFIYYLTVQLGFSINQVIANYSGTMQSAYNALTGDASNPFPIFSGLIASAFPAGVNVTSMPGPNPQNLFPIAQVQFYIQKNTFGKDETQDIIDNQGGLVSQAFWVVVTGFSRNSFASLHITVDPFTGTFADLQTNHLGVTITPNALGPQYENGVNATTPQTIRIPYDITFSSAVLGQFPSTDVSAPYILGATLSSNGVKVTGSDASTEFEFIAGADPYFANVDATNNQPYLSQDLRVFQAAPALLAQQTPFPNGPTFTDDSPQGAYAYIQALLDHLNGSPDFTNPAANIDPFALLPDQQGEGQTDTSVAPFVLNPNFPAGELVANNYNFAIARVRLRGEGTSTSPAKAENVRVFFRIFTTVTNDTDYDPSTHGTYASTPDSKGNPGTPVFGGTTPNNVTTIPFFATANPGSETDYQVGGYNNQTLTIPFGQHQLYHYYGCFLNFYDPTYEIAGQQVQTFLSGDHHCLVAEIAFDDAPIPAGVSAMSWDQLAQRNLQFTVIDNPGPVAAHRAPQLFDTRPSVAIGKPHLGTPPDELMIEWGDIPKGSVASLYWPGVAAAEVIDLVREWGGTAPITASDAHTLSIPVEGGVSYIPIPKGAGQNFAGLFTVEAPLGVKTGQEFEILVRRISTRTFTPPGPGPQQPILQTGPRHSVRTMGATVHLPAAPAEPQTAAPAPGPDAYRYVVGSFVVRIPVSTGEAMFFSEGMTLATMKWRLAHMSPSNRWVPVLKRYIEYLSARFDAIGGDAASVPASLTYVPPSLIAKVAREKTVCGKVSEVLFDCHGAFEGFVLHGCDCDCDHRRDHDRDRDRDRDRDHERRQDHDRGLARAHEREKSRDHDCDCEYRFLETRERGIAEVALRACQLNLTLCVTVDEACDRIVGLALSA
jgi:Listeria-Bacteroides repeat domain (List_Bact_rpt)